MSTRTDLHHGRQGGRFLPDDYEPTVVDLAPDCEACHLPMVVGQHRFHHLCRPNTLVGMTACTCPPGCTDLHVGDAGRCEPDCAPCRLHAGRPHDEIVEWRRHRKTGAATDADAELQLTLEATA